MTDADLLPCPFCASSDVEAVDLAPGAAGKTVVVDCYHCGMRGPLAADPETARQLWQRRPVPVMMQAATIRPVFPISED